MTNVTFARRLTEDPGSKSMTQHVLEPRRFMWWYDSLIDWMMANPSGSMEDAALFLGRSVVWVRIVANSDAFKARYDARRAQLSANIKDRLTDKVTKVAELTLDCIITRLEQTQDKVPLPILLDLQEKALQRLGYGVQPQTQPLAGGNQVNVQNNFYSVDKDTLVNARARLRAAEEMRRGVLVSSLDPVPGALAALDALGSPVVVEGDAAAATPAASPPITVDEAEPSRE